MKNMQPIRLVSCDLNGTLVHQHTMMDMIRTGFPHHPDRYEKARDVFTRQTAGLLSMEKTFRIAGPLTQGLSLRKAIEYALNEMHFLEGFEIFLSAIEEKDVYFVINSTGYTLTTEVIKILRGAEKFYDVICNRLVFGWQGNSGREIEEDALSEFVRHYFSDKKENKVYDEILATGEVELRIRDEKEKARLIFGIAGKADIPRAAIAHIGDTMGDSRCICEVAKNGGLGIAFNYNKALKDHLEIVLENNEISGQIILSQEKSKTSDLRSLLEVLFPLSSRGSASL